MAKKDAEVSWEGDSYDRILEFPAAVRVDLGQQLRQVQKGLLPKDSKPMRSVGSGVYELRDRDDKTWYRVIYMAKIEDTIYVLHTFKKNSAKTPKAELAVAEKRFKSVKARLRKEKKDGKN